MSEYSKIILKINKDLNSKHIITDIGSAKMKSREVIKKNLKKNIFWTSSHPISGSEVSGPEHGKQDMFDNKWCILIKDKSTNLWASPDAAFKSFNSSFVDSLDSFVGAQWGGAGLGQIFCVYVNSRDKLSLPAVLAYNVVAVEPTQSDDLSWEAKQGQTMNCHSTDTSKCAFQVRTKPKEESLSDVFDTIKPNSLNNNS